MKIKHIALLPVLVALLLFNVNVYAETPEQVGVTFTEPQGFVMLREDNLSKNEEFIKDIGYTKASAKKHFSDNNIVFLAADKNNAKQIQLQYAVTDFTGQVGELTDLDEEGVIAVASEIIDKNPNKWKIVLINGVKYIEARSTAKDSGGKYSVIQYFTIRNGALYTFSYYSSFGVINDAIIEDAWRAVGTMEIAKLHKQTDGNKLGNIIMIVLISVAILAAVAVIVWVVATYFLDIANRSAYIENDTVNRK